MSIENIAKICVETFSQAMNIPLASIRTQKIAERFVPHANPGPGQVGITSGSYVVDCTVAVPGARYVITMLSNGRGKVHWKQV